ncbi:MAG: hypothetical protein K6F33_08625 [Bacteroidales bacterium]|nr:hypothetical protein [Bacteroidales bacterium]
MLSIPLDIKSGRLLRDVNTKQSLDASLRLLLTTPRFSTPADPKFGFVFNNLRFEIFNEREGVVYNSGDAEDVHGLAGLYDKKVTGSSKNLNTFAAEFKQAVLDYEKRLKDIMVTMTYIREQRLIYVAVKGIIKATEMPYDFTTTIRVWN